MAKNTRTKYEREDNFRQISAMYLAGMTQNSISIELGISQPQVSYDLKAIRKQWRESTIVNMNEMVSRELARIDALEIQYWEAWRDSKERSEKARQRVGSEKQIIDAVVERETQSGDPAYLRGVQWCIEQRCKLLGLEQAIRQDVTIRDSRSAAPAFRFSALSVDEKRALLELHEKAEAGRGDDAPEGT